MVRIFFATAGVKIMINIRKLSYMIQTTMYDYAFEPSFAYNKQYDWT